MKNKNGTFCTKKFDDIWFKRVINHRAYWKNFVVFRRNHVATKMENHGNSQGMSHPTIKPSRCRTEKRDSCCFWTPLANDPFIFHSFPKCQTSDPDAKLPFIFHPRKISLTVHTVRESTFLLLLLSMRRSRIYWPHSNASDKQKWPSVQE